MIAAWGLAVARLRQAQRDESLVRSLRDANDEQAQSIRFFMREVSRLTFENATLREDNALMVDAVVNWPHALDRTAPTPRVH